MYRHILVISLNNLSSNFIKQFNNGNYVTTYSSNAGGLICMESDCFSDETGAYKFIGIDEFDGIDLHNIDEKQRSLIYSVLKPSTSSMPLLILFVTPKDEIVTSTYNSIYLMICAILNTQIPAIFVVSSCERDTDVEQWVYRNKKLLDHNILPFENIFYLWKGPRQLESVEEIWKAIEKIAMHSGKVMIFDKNTFKSQQTPVASTVAANVKSISKTGKTILCNETSLSPILKYKYKNYSDSGHFKMTDTIIIYDGFHIADVDLDTHTISERNMSTNNHNEDLTVATHRQFKILFLLVSQFSERIHCFFHKVFRGFV